MQSDSSASQSSIQSAQHPQQQQKVQFWAYAEEISPEEVAKAHRGRHIDSKRVYMSLPGHNHSARHVDSPSTSTSPPRQFCIKIPRVSRCRRPSCEAVPTKSCLRRSSVSSAKSDTSESPSTSLSSSPPLVYTRAPLSPSTSSSQHHQSHARPQLQPQLSPVLSCCSNCEQAWCYGHLPSPDQSDVEEEDPGSEQEKERTYSVHWSQGAKKSYDARQIADVCERAQAETALSRRVSLTQAVDELDAAGKKRSLHDALPEDLAVDQNQNDQCALGRRRTSVESNKDAERECFQQEHKAKSSAMATTKLFFKSINVGQIHV